MSQPRCENARRVLPPSLLEQVRRHVTGLVWVPGPERRVFKTNSLPFRDAQMRRERQKGKTIEQLAQMIRRSASLVWEIVHDVRINGSARRRA